MGNINSKIPIGELTTNGIGKKQQCMELLIFNRLFGSGG
jgi:hypothetical protein